MMSPEPSWVVVTVGSNAFSSPPPFTEQQGFLTKNSARGMVSDQRMVVNESREARRLALFADFDGAPECQFIVKRVWRAGANI